MSTKIRPAVQKDVDAICQLLHNKMNSRIPLERWRQLMNYPWMTHKPDFGRVVESNGKVLGFCGQVYVDRLVGTTQSELRMERMVSMSSWYLDKSLRGQGLGKQMLVSAIEDPTLTYATLTNSRKPIGIVEAIGFRVLEDRRYHWRKTNSTGSRLTLLNTVDDMQDSLQSYQMQLIEDMQGYPLVPLLMRSEGRQALLFFSIKRKANNCLWFDLMHCSDFELFAQNAQQLANQLLSEDTAVLAADGRFIPESCRKGLVAEKLPVSRYFMSQRVAAHEIDHLYSELQLLDLKLD